MYTHKLNIPKDKNSLIALAELFDKQYNHFSSLKYFEYIKNNFDFDINIELRIIDQLILLNNTESALEILNKIETKDALQYTRLEDRKNLINTRRAAKYKINIITDTTDIILNNQSNFIDSGKNLENFKISFTSKQKIEFLYIQHKNVADTIDNIIKPNVILNNLNYLYSISLNILNTHEIYILDTKSHKKSNKLLTIELTKILNYLRGCDGWLFLDNDSNSSRDQYIGKKLIDNFQCEEWLKYFLNLNSLKIPHLLVIPPSKEQVYSTYYPYKRSETCPIDQLIAISKQFSNPILYYPRDLLKNIDNSYSKTDTHWSFEAARIIFNKIFQILNIKIKDYKTTLELHEVSTIGDLGSKTDSFERAKSTMCTYNISDFLVFDNYLPSQGSIKIYQNSSAIDNKCLIIFGDSFSSAPLQFLVEYFSKVVVVRSNATVILSIIQAEKPDIILMEITERFIITAPKFLEKIDEYSPCNRVDQGHLINKKILDIDIQILSEPYKAYIYKYQKKLSCY